MRMQIRPHATLLTLCLSLAATGAFAGDGPAAPPAPSAPPPAAGYAVTAAVPNPPNPPNSPNIDEAALQAREAVLQSREAAAQAREAGAQARREAALQARLDAARERMEVAAQQLAALSAQMYGPMMQRFGVSAGPGHALIGVQLDRSSGAAGARVLEVSPGGPAQQAGVRSGDLIVAVNGADVRGKDSAQRIIERLRGVKPGDKVRLSVLRDGKTRDLTVTARPDWYGLVLAHSFPDVPLPPPPPFKALSAWGGGPMIIRGPVADLELARLTPGLGRYFGTDTGVLVVRAPPEGALGLRDGDVILSIDGRQPIDSSHVVRILASYDPGEKISMEVMRLHHRISIATTLPAEPAMGREVFMMRRGALLDPGPVIRRRDDRTID